MEDNILLKGELEVRLVNGLLFFGFVPAVQGGGEPPGGSFSVLESNSTFGALSNGDLTWTVNDTNHARVQSTVAKSTGKYYWEITVDSDSGSDFNMACAAVALDTIDTSVSFMISTGTTPNGYSYKADGTKEHNGSSVAYGSTYTTADILGVALDMDTGAVWFSKNGVWQGGATISEIEAGTTTNAAYTGLTGSFGAAGSVITTPSAITANFGATAFSFTVPTGFTAGLPV